MEQIIYKEEILEFKPKVAITTIHKGNLMHIPFAEITHVCRNGEEMIIYTNDAHYKTHCTMQELLSELPVNEFFRISKSFIISLKAVQRIEGNKLKIGEYSLPITQYYRKQLLQTLSEILQRNYLVLS